MKGSVFMEKDFNDVNNNFNPYFSMRWKCRYE